MPFGEKLFEETGKVTAASIESVHPTEGTTIKVNFTSQIQGFGKFPSGTNHGSGTIHQYPHGIGDASYQGVITTPQGEQFMWWAHEKNRVVEGGKVKGIVLVTGFSNSEKLSWLNRLVVLIEILLDPARQEFAGTGYEWK